MAKNNGGGSNKGGGSSNKGGGDLKSAISAAGPSVSKNEALQIASDTGKTVAQVMAKALANNAALESGLVNAYNKGSFGDASGLSAKAAGQLTGLQGLQMQPKTSYMGYSTTTTPGRMAGSGDGESWQPGTTTYNPIVLPRNYAPGGSAPAPAAAPAAAPVQQTSWEQSVNDSNQALIDSINQQIKANATQAELYMGQINQLMQSMTQASQQGGLQSITPYAVTSTSVDPASGAKTTSAITPRKKPTDTDLSISPLVADLSGTGLNIGI